jgi:hypothetical protein
MRGHPHGGAAYRDMHVFGCKLGWQVGWNAATEAQPEIVPGAPIARYAVDPELAARTRRNGVGAARERRQDARHRPIGNQLERGVRHRHQRKIAALADIKPTGAVLELASVVDEARKVLRAAARNPVVLDRPLSLPARPDL